MRLLVVLGAGGHTAQILKLVDLLDPVYDYSYLMSKDDQVSEGRIGIPGPVYRVNLPRHKDSNLLTTLKLSLLCSLQEFLVLIKARPEAILSTGAGIAVPISFLGRLVGVKIIHIESASRIRTLSVTGRIMYRIAHLFFVQWEALQKKYPKAIYAGRLL